MRPWVFWFFGLAISCGAGSFGGTLEDTLAVYHAHLRASDVDRASTYVAPEALNDFRALHDPEMNVFLVEEFSIGNVEPIPGSDRVLVVVQAGVRTKDSLIVRTVRFHEFWEKRKGKWVLVGVKMAKGPQGQEGR